MLSLRRSWSIAGLDDVDGYKNLQELLSKLDAALHVAPQTKTSAAVLAGGGSAKATSSGPRGNLAEPLVPYSALLLSHTGEFNEVVPRKLPPCVLMVCMRCCRHLKFDAKDHVHAEDR